MKKKVVSHYIKMHSYSLRGVFEPAMTVIIFRLQRFILAKFERIILLFFKAFPSF